MESTVKPFVMRMKEYFGQFVGQTIAEFKAELDKLSYEEKQWFAEQLNNAGVPTADPMRK